ncbi:MAG: response regulator [Candidatus Kapabacteria bacterium]|nr:response regulator [Candidatus Kapabacteria bacterium]
MIVALVDDDRVYQFTTERMLLRLNDEVNFRWFKDGEEALGYLQDHAHETEALPDLLILDINMPFMDGWQFLDAYAAKKSTLAKHIDIFMISSSADERDQVRAHSYSDVTGYLEKPITSDLLRGLLDRYIGGNATKH